jgi:hypothetical protein
MTVVVSMVAVVAVIAMITMIVVFVVVIITILLAASHRVVMFVLMLGLFVNWMPLEADLGWATWAII